MAEFVSVVHEVKSFPEWKAVYDTDAPRRKGVGLTDLFLGRETDNPNLVALLFSAADLAKAKDMAASAGLRETMRNAGVIGAPTMHFYRGEFMRRAAPHYLTATCRIKDIATFKKGYAMDKADRESATLSDLGVLQNVDDPNDLFLIWTVGDRGKATAFFQSPKLAEHQVKNAGLVGAPVAHFWNA